MKDSIGIIGLGRIGRCLVQGLLEASHYSRNQILFTTKHSRTRDVVQADLGIHPAKNSQELIEKCQTVIVAVKPQSLHEVLSEVKSYFTPQHLLISVVASLTTTEIEEIIAQKTPVIRAMPNIPIFVREGITAFCPGHFCENQHIDKVKKILASVGKVIQCEEKHMDAITGLSGSGPAYIYVIMESLTEGGIKVGLPRDIAIQLAAQTVLGAAKMLLETGRHPASLKDEVTTPAGCTIDGLLELEEGKLRVTLMKAVMRATERARLLSKS